MSQIEKILKFLVAMAGLIIGILLTEYSFMRAIDTTQAQKEIAKQQTDVVFEQRSK